MTAAAAATSSSVPSPLSHRPGKPLCQLPLPSLKSWGSQRLLCCVDAATSKGTTALPPSTSSPPVPGAGDRDDEFGQSRAKLLNHLREAAGRIELPPSVASGEERRKEPSAEVRIEESGDDGDDKSHATVAVPQANPSTTVSLAATPPHAASASSSPIAQELPWNLRTRRSALSSNVWHHHANPEHPTPTPPPAKPASRLRSRVPERREGTLRWWRPKFSVPLTKEEIDEDVYAFTGHLAARRPKKRPRVVQSQLDMLFLSEVTLDMYQVADPPPPPPS